MKSIINQHPIQSLRRSLNVVDFDPLGSEARPHWLYFSLIDARRNAFRLRLPREHLSSPTRSARNLTKPIILQFFEASEIDSHPTPSGFGFLFR